MLPDHAIADICYRRPAIPWHEPIRVHFCYDEAPLYGCRLCILKFGLAAGDRGRLFADEAVATAHTGRHAAACGL